MTRKAELTIESAEAWHLLGEVFNEMFECGMWDDGYGVQMVRFTGIKQEGIDYLKKKGYRHPNLKGIGLE